MMRYVTIGEAIQRAIKSMEREAGRSGRDRELDAAIRTLRRFYDATEEADAEFLRLAPPEIQ